jgi:hypothetical protein
MSLPASTVTGADHLVPLNVITCAPVLATQNVALAQDTVSNSAPASAVTGADQVVPL